MARKTAAEAKEAAVTDNRKDLPPQTFGHEEQCATLNWEESRG